MISRPCAAPGCRTLIASGRSWCPRHAAAAAQDAAARKARFDLKRQSSPKRLLYKNEAWTKRSKAQLAAEPLCAMCLEKGRTKAASLADHIVRHNGDPALFWSGALQSLCWSCHSRHKQRAERQG